MVRKRFESSELCRRLISRSPSMQEALQKAIDDKRVVSQGLVRLCGVLQDKLRENFSPNFTGGMGQENQRTGTDGQCAASEFHLDDELHIHSASDSGHPQAKIWKRRSAAVQAGYGTSGTSRWSFAGLKDMETPTEELLEGELEFNQRRFYQILSRMTLELDGFSCIRISNLLSWERWSTCARMTEAGVSLLSRLRFSRWSTADSGHWVWSIPYLLS